MSFTADQIATTFDTLLSDIKADLIAGLADAALFTAKNIFITDFPTPEASRDNLFVTISPADGDFDQSALEGGGEEVCIEQTGVIFTVYSRQQTDRHDEAEQIFLGEADVDKSRSLTDIKRRILKTFTNSMLVDGSGNYLLTETMIPVRSTKPERIKLDNGAVLAQFGIIFSLAFLWDLS